MYTNLLYISDHISCRQFQSYVYRPRIAFASQCILFFLFQVASFPFDDHNCPPIQLIPSFCQSAYTWLKDDIQNVVVVHCKAGMARTGLMICCLLLYLKVKT